MRQVGIKKTIAVEVSLDTRLTSNRPEKSLTGSRLLVRPESASRR